MSERSQIFGDRSDSLDIFISAIISQSFLLRCRPPILFILIYLHTVAGFFLLLHTVYLPLPPPPLQLPHPPPCPICLLLPSFLARPRLSTGPHPVKRRLPERHHVSRHRAAGHEPYTQLERKKASSEQQQQAAASRKLDFHIILRLNSKKLSIFCACEIFGFEKRAVQKERKNPVHHAGRIHTFVLKLNRQKRKI